MVREISAGGVVVERAGEGWKLAVIEPQIEAASTRPARKTSQKLVLALPKGLVDPGEKPEQTALREVREETGLVATPVAKLGYHSGVIDDLAPEMRVEVKRAAWIPLDEAPRKLAYRGERDMVKRALQFLKTHPEV